MDELNAMASHTVMMIGAVFVIVDIIFHFAILSKNVSVTKWKIMIIRSLSRAFIYAVGTSGGGTGAVGSVTFRQMPLPRFISNSAI